MEKIICIGHQNGIGNTYCRIKFADGRLSITGVEGPKANGDCRGACGQIIMHEWDFDYFADGWNHDLVDQFRVVWEKWHLNDLTPGSPDQTAWIQANPLDTKYPKNHYSVYSEALASAGLNPDTNFLHNGKPYKYGSAWLRRDIPQSVIDFLAELPESKTVPAWV